MPCDKRPEELSGLRGKHLSQARAKGRESASVRPRVGHEENQVTAGVVTQLQSELSFERLTIRDAGLGLDPGAPLPRLMPADLRVPGAQVAFDRERDLRAVPKTGVEARSEAVEQGQLSPIPNGVAGRIRANRDVEPEHGKPGANVGNVESLDVPALKAQQLGIGGAGSACARSQTQPRRGPRLAMFATEPPKRITRPSSASIRWSFSGGHSGTGWRCALHRGSIADCVAGGNR